MAPKSIEHRALLAAVRKAIKRANLIIYERERQQARAYQDAVEILAALGRFRRH